MASSKLESTVLRLTIRDALRSPNGPIISVDQAEALEERLFKAVWREPPPEGSEPIGCPTPGACSCPGSESVTARPKRETIHMATAYMWGRRSVCKRNQVGCVITTQDMRRVLSIGYNGPAAALSHDECNEELTDRDGCGCLHAEMNAVAAVDSSISDKIVFVTVMPCRSCAQLLAQSNVSRVYYSRKYRNEYGIVLLRDAGVDAVRLAHEHVATLLRS